jgi:uncharacterized membrane protein
MANKTVMASYEICVTVCFMMMNIKLFFIAFLLVPIIDYVWLARIMSNFYLRELGDIARSENGAFSPMLWPAAVVYVCLGLGVVFFSLPKVQPEDPLWMAAVWGGLLGFVVYGVYDMTNLSLVARWPILMSVVDILWGTTLCALVTVLTKIARDQWLV